MHKTQLTLAIAALGLAGVMASTQASAQIATTNSGNSDLMFVAVDTVTGTTFYDNLGVLALPTTALTSQSFDLSSTGGAAWSAFTTAAGGDAVSYAVFGGANKNGAANTTGLNTYSITVGGSGVTPTAPSNNNLAQFNLIDQNIINPLNSGSYAVKDGSGYEVTDPAYEYTDGNSNTSVNGKFGGVTTTTKGGSNDFYAFTQVKGSLNSTAELLGAFAFAGSTLTYTAVGGSTAPVPLPAAVWLLGSGLFGLIGIGRRRAA